MLRGLLLGCTKADGMKGWGRLSRDQEGKIAVADEKSCE